MEKVRIDIDERAHQDYLLSDLRDSVARMDLAFQALGEYGLPAEGCCVSDMTETKAMRREIDNMKNLLVECSHG